ncbi:MAG TPA: DUF4097 family beta strand repeat-containing protein, partial [Bryobacteraceae bacterium]|nr:DUF4097 family beta strand repeat-containing protein [Bryobacteraceae bacterium]
MRTRLARLAVPACFLLMAGCEFVDFGDSSRHQEDFHESHAMKAGGRIYLESFNGSVEIAGWNQDSVDISGTKYASSEQMLRALKIDVTASGDSVRIRAARPSDRWGNMGARFTIRVPRSTTLERISTSNGSITATDIDAPVRLRTSNGRVSVEGIRGTLDVATSNGSIRATVSSAGDSEPVRLRTSNGSVDLTVERLGRSDISVNSSNASLTVRLPDRIAADVSASTSNGSITN